MKKTTVLMAMAICLWIFLPQFGYTQASTYAEDEIIARFKEGVTLQEQIGFAATINGTIVDYFSAKDVLIKISTFEGLVDDDGNMLNAPGIIGIHDEDAEIDDLDLNYNLTQTPLNLVELQELYNMEAYSPVLESCLDDNNYPGGHLFGCEVDDKGGRIKVAIIDTGIDHNDYNDFVTQYVRLEINTLGIGDDPDGRIYTPSAGAVDANNGHGGKIAGIVTGLSQRAGFTPSNLGLYIIKSFNDEGYASLFTAMKGVYLAIENEVHIINLSWSYIPVAGDDSQILEDLLRGGFVSKGGGKGGAGDVVVRPIIVAGAGNDGFSLDQTAIYPASIENERMVTVGGVNCAGEKSSFSNYGNAVDIYAPAEGIIAPALGGYWTNNAMGTSFAAPIVVGTLIQALSKYLPTDPMSGDFGSISTEDLILVRNSVVNSAAYSPYSEMGYGIISVVDFEAACAQASQAHDGDTKSLKANHDENNQIADIHKKKEVITLQKDISIFPNPFSDQLTIALNATTREEEVASIEIWTVLGEKIVSTEEVKYRDGTLQLDFDTQMPKGLYLLKIKYGNQMYTNIIVRE